ncbi:GspE family protein, partial [Escherichia coli]
QIILPNWQATGCQFCYSGYKGRTAIYDCFELSKQSLPSPYALFNSGIELIKKGITSLDEVYQVVGDIE